MDLFMCVNVYITHYNKHLISMEKSNRKKKNAIQYKNTSWKFYKPQLLTGWKTSALLGGITCLAKTNLLPLLGEAAD